MREHPYIASYNEKLKHVKITLSEYEYFAIITQSQCGFWHITAIISENGTGTGFRVKVIKALNAPYKARSPVENYRYEFNTREELDTILDRYRLIDIGNLGCLGELSPALMKKDEENT